MTDLSYGCDVHRERTALHVVFVVDVSGSMSGERMGSLNWAAKAAIPAMRDVAIEHSGVEVLVRVCCFSDEVVWPVASPVPVESFVWANLTAGGESRMGAALEAVAAALAAPEMQGPNNLPAVVVLLSDGMPSDDVRAGITALDASDRGRQAIRIPIAIGSDADLETLQAFIGHPELRPLRANNAETLVRRMRWAATSPLVASTRSATLSPGADPLRPEPDRSPESEAEGGLVW
ncbi:VWA domain-containing protein [uncultured Enterovirga sp.]|uniref:vWA domain-containing protein n=1 Tax=uncultured Enterovirga sp. TaxID=2026352 RepID=UPI0035CA4619